MADKSVKISVDMVGERALESLFDHIEHIPDDWREPFEGMAEDFWTQNQKTFDEEGPGWKPLSLQYAKWKERKFPGEPILVRTGALRASLVEGHAPHSIFDIHPTEMTLGTDVRYGIYHQTGSIKVRDHPPKRSPIMITPELQKNWNRRLANWLRDEIGYQG